MSVDGGFLQDALDALRKASVPRERSIGDLDCNAVLWLGTRAGLDAGAASLALGSDVHIDTERLTEAPYLAALGFARATGARQGDATMLRDVLSGMLERKAHTKERAGFADRPWVLIGLTLLAKSIDDYRGQEVLTGHVIELLRSTRTSASVALGAIHAIGLARAQKTTWFEVASARAEAVLAAHSEAGIFERLFPGQTRERAYEELISHARMGKFEPSARMSSLLALTALEVVLFADKRERVSASETKKSGSPSPRSGYIEPYQLEKQPWHCPLPEILDIDPSKAPASVDVVLMVATPAELEWALRRFMPREGASTIERMHAKHEVYYIGRCGAFDAALVMSDVGSTTAGGADYVALEALKRWKPRALILTGMAFGTRPDKQQVGDVLVASHIVPYERQRLGVVHVYRGAKPPSSSKLLNRFRNAVDWRFVLPNGKTSRIHEGEVLSGEKLFDDRGARDELVKRFPDAIGGEMEAVGAYGAAARENVECIVVKGIADFGEQKRNEHQPLAVAAALGLIVEVLSCEGALKQ